ncbi:MAG: hypothetical protein HYR97_05710 [Candidatus Melainabacteria bacterium]|nr:hypothetical protein [Candidatus Melainabacteria bacterium]
MRKLLFNIVILTAIIITCYAFKRSEKTFEATFRNIDGLPIGAPVSALGTKIGEILKTTPIDEGVKVTVRITNKKIPPPPPGSLLTITSYKPGQARVLEIIPPSPDLGDSKAWLMREPITTESWLTASMELWNGLKNFSEITLKYLTHENVTKVRTTIEGFADTLNTTAEKIRGYEKEFERVTERLSLKANEANELVTNLRQSLDSLNAVLVDKQIAAYLKDHIGEFSKNITEIKDTVSNPMFITKVSDVKSQILDQLNQTNAILIDAKENIKNQELIQNINRFNENVTNLNKFYDNLLQKDVKKIAAHGITKAKEVTEKASQETGKLLNKTNSLP